MFNKIIEEFKRNPFQIGIALVALFGGLIFVINKKPNAIIAPTSSTSPNNQPTIIILRGDQNDSSHNDAAIPHDPTGTPTGPSYLTVRASTGTTYDNQYSGVPIFNGNKDESFTSRASYGNIIKIIGPAIQASANAFPGFSGLLYPINGGYIASWDTANVF